MTIRIFDRNDKEQSMKLAYDRVKTVIGSDIYFQDGEVYHNAIAEDEDWKEV